jgi:hypothetical protein
MGPGPGKEQAAGDDVDFWRRQQQQQQQAEKLPSSLSARLTFQSM